MLRTIVTPYDNTICISIPSNYVGKKVEVLLYTSEEIKEDTAQVQKCNAARFKGIFTSEEADNYHQYLRKARQEWDRNI